MPSKTGLDYEDYRDGKFVPDKGGPYNDDQLEQLFQEAYNDSYFLSNIIVRSFLGEIVLLLICKSEPIWDLNKCICTGSVWF